MNLVFSGPKFRFWVELSQKSNKNDMMCHFPLSCQLLLLHGIFSEKNLNLKGNFFPFFNKLSHINTIKKTVGSFFRGFFEEKMVGIFDT